MTLYLVRHASTRDTGVRLSGRLPGISLNAEGRREAAILAERVTKTPVAAIYSSPLERAVETAGVIGAAVGLDVRCVPELTEIDFGQWTGRTLRGLEGDAEWTRFNTDPERAAIPAGEALEHVTARATYALLAIAERHRGENVIAVSHGDVIRLALTRLLRRSLGDFRHFDIPPASLSYVRFGDEPRLLLTVHNHVAGASAVAGGG